MEVVPTAGDDALGGMTDQRLVDSSPMRSSGGWRGRAGLGRLSGAGRAGGLVPCDPGESSAVVAGTPRSNILAEQ